MPVIPHMAALGLAEAPFGAVDAVTPEVRE
jgi:hypothetical protein